MLKNTATRYGSVAQFFHWLIFILVFCMLIIGYLMGDISDKTMRGQVVNAHKVIGVTILILMLLRLGWALINVKPQLPFQTPAWQQLVERLVHWALYIGLILMPLSGVIGAMAAGKPPHINEYSLSLPIAQNKELAKWMFAAIHQPLAIILIVLISLHVLAALYHHFIKRDDILRRMLFNSTRR